MRDIRRSAEVFAEQLYSAEVLKCFELRAVLFLHCGGHGDLYGADEEVFRGVIRVDKLGHRHRLACGFKALTAESVG